jgi:sodium-dependent dicarboxylate transporter 2/3/5
VQTGEVETVQVDYKSAPPPAETITAAEERFERWRKASGWLLGPLAFVAVFLLLRNSGLTPEGRRLSAILALTGILWVTEALPLPVTALVGAALAILLGVADARTVLAQFAHPIIFLFMGSFFLARAMEIHGLDRRVALRILAIPAIGAHPGRVLAAMGAITAVISMWVSNTATTAMMVPIAMGILAALHEVRSRAGLAKPGPLDARNWPFATGMMLMIAYGASIGGIGTKVGSPPNLITMGALEKAVLPDGTNAAAAISFFTWMKVMVPILGLMFVVLFALLFILHPDRTRKRSGGAEGDGKEARLEAAGLLAYLRQERGRLGRWSAGEVNTLLAFGVAVTLWVLPGFLQAIFPNNKALLDVFGKSGPLPEEVVGLAAGLLLFILPTNVRQARFTLNWADAVKIEWGTLLLFGGGLALGELMFKTGVAEALGKWAVGYAGGQGVWSLTAAMIVLGIVLSETTSNTAAATMLAPVAIAISHGMDVSPIPPALGTCLGASYGFMLPISTAPNAIVFGTGLVPITRMMRAGILFDIIGAAVIWCGLRVLLPAMGLA